METRLLLASTPANFLSTPDLEGEPSEMPITPVGPEALVNTTRIGDQLDSTTAMDNDGNYVVIWRGTAVTGKIFQILGQRYDASGSPLGSEFQVNSSLAGTMLSPSVAIDPVGNFIVVWLGDPQQGTGYEVYFRRFSTDGTPLTGEIQVNQTTAGIQESPTIAVDRTGAFLVVWTSNNGPNGSDILARSYDSAGVPLGDEYVVNTYRNGTQSSPALTMDPDGSSVVAWQSQGQDGSGYGIYAQRVNPDGTLAGTEFQVNTYTTGDQIRPVASINLYGRFVITWQSGYVGDSHDRTYAQIFTSSGTKAGEEFRMEGNRFDDPLGFATTMDDSGNILVVSIDDETGRDDYVVLLSQYDATGNLILEPRRVNTYIPAVYPYADDQVKQPTITKVIDGQFVVTWSSWKQDGSSYGIYMQQFTQAAASGSITGNTWQDLNGDHVRSELDPVMAGVVVQLYNKARAFIAETVTDIDGSYSFSAVPASTELLVKFFAPITWAFAKPTQGSDPTLDSDANADGWTEVFTIAAGQSQSGPDVGFSKPGNIQGTIYEDTNRNGQHDTEEHGLGGWFVYLDENDNATWDPTERRVKTLPDGSFAFDRIISGDYVVRTEVQPLWENNPISVVSLSPGETVSGIALANFSNAIGYPIKPDGSQFRVDTVFSNSRSAPQIAMNSAGQYVVVWVQRAVNGLAVYGQLYDANGGTVGPQFVMPTYEWSYYPGHSVAIDAQGNFVVTWIGQPDEESPSAVYGRRFDSMGNPLEDRFKIGEFIEEGVIIGPNTSVAMDTSGNFVVSWVRKFADGTVAPYARRYLANGTPSGLEFQVDTFDQEEVAYWGALTTKMTPTGEFLFFWNGRIQHEFAPSTHNQFVRMFDANGNEIGNTRTLDLVVDGQGGFASGTNAEFEVAVAADGSFIVLYRTDDSECYEAVFFDSEANPTGTRTTVGYAIDNTRRTGEHAIIVTDPNGGFATMLSFANLLSNDYAYYAQRFDAAGRQIDDAFQATEPQTDRSSTATMGIDGEGNLLVAWGRYVVNNPITGTYAQRFRVSPPPELSVEVSSVFEGDSSTTQVPVTFRLSEPTDREVTVNYQTSDGTAIGQEDYLPIPLTELTFQPGELEKTVYVDILSDLLAEPDKVFSIDVLYAINAVNNQDHTDIVILDDDRTLSAQGETILRPYAASTMAEFLVTIPYPSSLPIDVDYDTSESSAISGEDYIAVSGTLHFAPGETQKIIPVEVLPGQSDPTGRSITLQLSSPVNIEIDDTPATIVLLGRPQLVVESIDIAPIVDSGQPITVSWTITNVGNAAASAPWTDRFYLSSDQYAGEDQLLGVFPFTGTINPGESVVRTQQISIPVNLEGDLWAIVHTDFFDQLEEHDESLGTTISDHAINVAPGIVLAGNEALSIQLVKTRDISPIGSTRQSMPTESEVFHEWETVAAELWLTVDEAMRSEPLNLKATFSWSKDLFLPPELQESLGLSASLIAEDNDVILEQAGIDLSLFQPGDQVMVATILLPTNTENAAGITLEPLVSYPSVQDVAGFQLLDGRVGAEERLLNFSPEIDVQVAPVIYDANEDGQIGLNDFASFISNYGKRPDANAMDAYRFDYNRDGKVGLADFALFISNYGRKKSQTDVQISLPLSLFHPVPAKPSLPLEQESIDLPPDQALIGNDERIYLGMEMDPEQSVCGIVGPSSHEPSADSDAQRDPATLAYRGLDSRIVDIALLETDLTEPVMITDEDIDTGWNSTPLDWEIEIAD